MGSALVDLVVAAVVDSTAGLAVVGSTVADVVEVVDSTVAEVVVVEVIVAAEVAVAVVSDFEKNVLYDEISVE